MMMPVAVAVIVVVIMAVTVTVAMIVSAVLRIERHFDDRKPRTQAAEHVLDHVIASDAEAVAGDLHVDVAIADVPGEPRQFVGACGGDFDERFGPSDDAHDSAILQHKSVAVMQGNRLWEVEQKRRPTLAGQNDPAAMPVMGVEHDRIDGAGVIPVAGRPDFTSTLHSHSMMLV